MTTPARTPGRKGALPNDPSRPRISLADVIQGTAPAEAHFGHIPSIGMLGNDEWGDCVYAGIGHLAEAATYFGQRSETAITTAQALAAYSGATGFDPNAGQPGSNPTDNGSTLQAGLEWLVQHGIGGVEFAAFGELNIADTNKWKQALATFGPLMLGVGVGDTEMSQFSAGQPWALTPGAQQQQEDHCVILTGYSHSMYWVWTWGAIQGIDPAWFEVNAYEVWAAVSRDWVNAHTGRDVEGVNLARYGQLFTQITGQPDPFQAAAGQAGV